MSTVEKIQELKKSRAALESSGKAARERISMVLDPLSFVEIGAFVNHRSTDFNMVSQDTPAETGLCIQPGRVRHGRSRWGDACQKDCKAL
mgnify:CR=1 FL=1